MNLCIRNMHRGNQNNNKIIYLELNIDNQTKTSQDQNNEKHIKQDCLKQVGKTQSNTTMNLGLKDMQEEKSNNTITHLELEDW